jgi:hypothetical protein
MRPDSYLRRFLYLVLASGSFYLFLWILFTFVLGLHPLELMNGILLSSTWCDLNSTIREWVVVLEGGSLFLGLGLVYLAVTPDRKGKDERACLPAGPAPDGKIPS